MTIAKNNAVNLGQKPGLKGYCKGCNIDFTLRESKGILVIPNHRAEDDHKLTNLCSGSGDEPDRLVEEKNT